MKIELHIPGLLAVPARLAERLRLPAHRALQQWHARAQVTSTVPGRHGFLARRIGAVRAPMAALAWMGEYGGPPDCPTYLATPVHFEAGMRDLVLFAGAGLRITSSECATIAALASEHFGGHPAFCVAGETLFLQLPAALDAQSTPLYRAQGLPVRQRLPQGSDAPTLNRWINELQMLLHSHEINRDRSARGLPTLNGVWIWGEGDLPAHTRPAAVIVHATSPAMRGLGRLLGIAAPPLGSPLQLANGDEHVVEIPACADALDADDALSWERAVTDVADNWLDPLLHMVDSGKVSEVVLYAGDGFARRVIRNGWWRRVAATLRRADDLQLRTED